MASRGSHRTDLAWRVGPRAARPDRGGLPAGLEALRVAAFSDTAETDLFVEALEAADGVAPGSRHRRAARSRGRPPRGTGRRPPGAGRKARRPGCPGARGPCDAAVRFRQRGAGRLAASAHRSIRATLPRSRSRARRSRGARGCCACGRYVRGRRRALPGSAAGASCSPRRCCRPAPIATRTRGRARCRRRPRPCAVPVRARFLLARLRPARGGLVASPPSGRPHSRSAGHPVGAAR